VLKKTEHRTSRNKDESLNVRPFLGPVALQGPRSSSSENALLTIQIADKMPGTEAQDYTDGKELERLYIPVQKGESDSNVIDFELAKRKPILWIHRRHATNSNPALWIEIAESALIGVTTALAFVLLVNILRKKEGI